MHEEKQARGGKARMVFIMCMMMMISVFSGAFMNEKYAVNTDTMIEHAKWIWNWMEVASPYVGLVMSFFGFSAWRRGKELKVLKKDARSKATVDEMVAMEKDLRDKINGEVKVVMYSLEKVQNENEKLRNDFEIVKNHMRKQDDREHNALVMLQAQQSQPLMVTSMSADDAQHRHADLIMRSIPRDGDFSMMMEFKQGKVVDPNHGIAEHKCPEHGSRCG
jgi:hypothetical protein